MEQLEVTPSLVLATVAAIALPMVAFVHVQQRRRRATNVSWEDELESTKHVPAKGFTEIVNMAETQATAKTSEKSSSSSSSVPQQRRQVDPDDAWEERRRRGIAAASLHEKKDATTEKPFGSSYYYAHNSTKTTGGYKDGLRMEDFTMNGPRLLSKGGKAVTTCDADVVASTDDILNAATNGGVKSDSVTPAVKKKCIDIGRYLWDDPGKGIGIIRIDELPGSKTGETLSWKDASSSISNISAQLVNGGLLVSIETATAVDYRLHVPALFGEVEKVETATKTKRLLVKLTKKYSILNKSNANAWPYPQKKS